MPNYSRPDPKVFIEQMDAAFRIVRRTLAPGMRAREYLHALDDFEKRYVNAKITTRHGDKIFSPEEAAQLPDNSADYENFKYLYRGFDRVRELIDAGTPVALITWHPGAIRHNDYALARILPEIAIFTLETYQYGKVFSYPMLRAGPLSLVRMNRFLNDGRPTLYYIDGAPTGETAQLSMLGIPSNLSVGPIRVIRSVPGVRIVPVTNFYRGGDTVHTTFHPPLPEPDEPSETADRDVLAALLSCFENDLREHAPEQLVLRLLVNRERMAKSMTGYRTVTNRRPAGLPKTPG